jgi:hypothetical protein
MLEKQLPVGHDANIGTFPEPPGSSGDDRAKGKSGIFVS